MLYFGAISLNFTLDSARLLSPVSLSAQNVLLLTDMQMLALYRSIFGVVLSAFVIYRLIAESVRWQLGESAQPPQPAH